MRLDVWGSFIFSLHYGSNLGYKRCEISQILSQRLPSQSLTLEPENDGVSPIGISKLPVANFQVNHV